MPVQTTIDVNSKKLQRLGLGTWQIQPCEAAEQVVYDAIKCGYRHIDCAAVYNNEKFVGKGIKRAIDEKLVTREDLWITSKLWNTNHEAKRVEEACLLTLSKLGLKYLDLYLVHFPISLEYVSPETNDNPMFFTESKKLQVKDVPLHETWGAMEKLVQKKLVRHIGVSNFDFQLLQDLLKYCKIKPLVNQIELHLYLQQKRMIRFCEQFGIYVTGYSLMGGEAYDIINPLMKKEVVLMDRPELHKLSRKYKKTVSQIILRWALQLSPNLIFLAKSSHSERVYENFQIFDFELTQDEMTTLAAFDCNKRLNDTAAITDDASLFWPIFA